MTIFNDDNIYLYNRFSFIVFIIKEQNRKNEDKFNK